MRKLFILLVIIVGIYLLAKHFLAGEKFDNLLDQYQNPIWVPRIEYYLGEYHIVFARWDKAVHRFNRVIKNYPDSVYTPKARLSLARAYEGMGEKGKAIKEYEKIVELYPKTTYRRIAEERLNFMR